MFSVPLSIEILAPAESAYHSSGTPIDSAMSSAPRMRRHSGSASDPTSRLGIAEQRDARHAFRILRGPVRQEPDDHVRRVLPVGPLDRHQRPGLVQIEFQEGPRRNVGRRPCMFGRHETHDFVRVRQSALAHPHDALVVGGQRTKRLCRRRGKSQHRRAPGRQRDGGRPVGHRAVVVRHGRADDDLLEAQPFGMRRHPRREVGDLGAAERRAAAGQTGSPGSTATALPPGASAAPGGRP